MSVSIDLGWEIESGYKGVCVIAGALCDWMVIMATNSTEVRFKAFDQQERPIKRKLKLGGSQRILSATAGTMISVERNTDVDED